MRLTLALALLLAPALAAATVIWEYLALLGRDRTRGASEGHRDDTQQR